MPPRFAYWTILIDDKPTAFRARDQQELLPTVAQLKRKNEHVELKWFAQGRLWDSPEAQYAAGRRPQPPAEKRGDDWRPGGQHKDPRARFDKEAQRRKKREQRAEWNASRPADARRDRDAPSAPPRGDRPSQDRKWQTKPTGPRVDRKPWQREQGGPPRGDRKPWDKRAGGPPHGERKPWQSAGGDRPPGERKPWQNADGDRPRGERKPWQKPAGGPPRSGRTWSAAPPRGDDRPPRKRNDEPPDER